MIDNDPPSVGQDVVVMRSALADLVGDILVAYGATRSDARIQAATLVEAELRGHASHGIRRLTILTARLTAGLAVSGVRPRLRWTTRSVLQVDGRAGLGPVVAIRSVDAIIGRAKRTGIAMAAVQNSNHIGMLAPYLERMAAAGMIGLAFTTSEALVHPWGGARALVGTNPVGIAVPTATEPLVLDMATGASSMGKILDHAEKGIPIPAGWAVGQDGAPTTDASVARTGAISPFGGAKGFALGIALEALVSTLTGSALGTAVRGTLDADSPATKGDVFVAVSLRRLGLSVDALIPYLDEVRASAVGEHTVSIPGDRARSERAHRIAGGIPIHPASWAQLNRLRDEAPR